MLVVHKDDSLRKAISESSTLVEILEVLSIKARHKLGVQGPCALFFDEIQAVPNLIKHLRYFKEDYPHLHVVAAGSSLELALKKVGSFPVGRVAHLFMKPLDFEEFLWARGQLPRPKGRSLLEEIPTSSHVDPAKQERRILFELR